MNAETIRSIVRQNGLVGKDIRVQCTKRSDRSLIKFMFDMLYRSDYGIAISFNESKSTISYRLTTTKRSVETVTHSRNKAVKDLLAEYSLGMPAPQAGENTVTINIMRIDLVFKFKPLSDKIIGAAFPAKVKVEFNLDTADVVDYTYLEDIERIARKLHTSGIPVTLE